MLRIFSPAVAAIVIQLAAVTVITVVFYFLAQGLAKSEPASLLCEADATCHTATLLARLSYLLTAFGAAFTNNRLIARTTRWVRRLSRAFHERNGLLAKAVTVQLAITIIACIVVELDTPPETAVAVGQWIGGGWIGAVYWPALWSVGVAGVGAITHATLRAVF
jgi:hypothetical protein